MKRLSALDALFLYLETPETPMNVGSVTIFTPDSPRDDLFDRFCEHTAARLDLLPIYRRRLEPTPLGLDHPVWLVDDRLDLAYHIRHAALPKPGGMKELRALIAQLHAIPLDRARPLWEYTFIEGLEGGAFAIYAKVHHSAMDGLAGMATLGVIFDFAPDAESEKIPQSPVSPDREPSDFIELTSTAIGDFVRQGWRAVSSLPYVARALTKSAPHFGREARYLYSYVKDMPRTPFNAAISRHRVYATSSLPLPEVKALAKSRGVTVNDVVIALCAGALRRYLAWHAALPEKPLTAAVPASFRPLGDAQLNNQVMFTFSRLPTNIADPLARVAAAQAAGQDAKNLFADTRDFFTTEISIIGAPLLVMGLTRLWSGARAANYAWPFFNLILSNVPGPRQPMYCVGAKATHYFPASIAYHGCALNITVQSYLDQLDFGLVACRETVPDAQRIADCLAEDFAAMQEADAASRRTEAVEAITVAARPPPLAHVPIALGEAIPKPRRQEVEKTSGLTESIDALRKATEALQRGTENAEAPVAAKPAGARAKAKSMRAVTQPATERPADPKSPNAKAEMSSKAPRPARRRRKPSSPARVES